MRLEGFDYSAQGAYFITICTQDRVPVLGRFEDEILCVTEAGGMASRWWSRIPDKFCSVSIDSFVVMPDHLHGILWLHATGDARTVTLGRVVAWFKTMTTNEYIRSVPAHGWPPFERRLWQRNYFDHVVRDEKSLDRLRTYIEENPVRWHPRAYGR